MQMLPSHVRLPYCLLCTLLAFFVFPSVSFAQFGLNQQRIPEAQWSRGFHGFNMIAEGNELERISVEQFQATDSSEVLLIAIGNLKNLGAIVTNHVNDGGSALLASDSSVRIGGESYAGFRFAKLNDYPTSDDDAFGRMKDCPIIRTFRAHPTLNGVNELVTNNPGRVLGNPDLILAWYPAEYQRNKITKFIAARENRNGGRVVAIGDQSIFTNQMIYYGNNAEFANQTISWLKNGKPKKMLILVDGAQHSNLGPADVAIETPAPTQQEVLDALRNLPPAAMMEFANSVATVVEDENMVNDLLHDAIDQVPEQAMNRFYIFLMFGVACLSLVVAFLFQGKLQRQTASELAFKQSQNEQTELKAIQSRERQQAAHMLLDRFCMNIANRRFSDWPSFPTGLNIDEDQKSEHLFQSMTKMSVLYKSKPSSFWTRKKLARLEKEVSQWQAYFEGRSELVDAELLQSQSHWSNQSLLE